MYIKNNCFNWTIFKLLMQFFFLFFLRLPFPPLFSPNVKWRYSRIDPAGLIALSVKPPDLYFSCLLFVCLFVDTSWGLLFNQWLTPRLLLHCFTSTYTSGPLSAHMFRLVKTSVVSFNSQAFTIHTVSNPFLRAARYIVFNRYQTQHERDCDFASKDFYTWLKIPLLNVTITVFIGV